MKTAHGMVIAALLLVGCKQSDKLGDDEKVAADAVAVAPAEKPGYANIAKQLMAWIPDGANVAVAYLDLKHLTERQGKLVAENIREVYPDRMDVYLANAARGAKKRITVVDRRNMTHFLAAQKLQASDMLPLDPKSRVKLQRVTAVNTYVYWKVIREGVHEEWILRAVGVETGQLYGGLVHRYRRVGNVAADDENVSFYWSSTEKLYAKARRGHVNAMLAIGSAFEHGQGTDTKMKLAARWYRRAALEGNVKGAYHLGRCYQKGIGVYKNWREAMSWYRKAADAGDPPACFEVARMLEQGAGAPRDRKLARAYYAKAAEGGHPPSMLRLGVLNHRGTGAEEPDYPEALRWFRLAASNGLTGGLLWEAHMYRHGRGVPKNLKLARTIYLNAFKQGDSWASKELKSIDAELAKQAKAK